MTTNNNSDKRKWEIVESALDALHESEGIKRRRLEPDQKVKAILLKRFENKPRSKLLKDEIDQIAFQFMSECICLSKLVRALSVPDAIIREIAEYGMGYTRKCANEECDDVVVRLRGDANGKRFVNDTDCDWHCKNFYCTPCAEITDCPSGCGDVLSAWGECEWHSFDPRGTYYGFNRCDVCKVTMCYSCSCWCENCDEANHEDCDFPESNQHERWCKKCKDLCCDEVRHDVYGGWPE